MNCISGGGNFDVLNKYTNFASYFNKIVEYQITFLSTIKLKGKLYGERI